MTRLNDDKPATREQFEARLRTLLAQAHDNGVDVRDGIDVRNPDTDADHPGWSVEIVPFAEEE